MTDRPGGWVEGIGWVAPIETMKVCDEYHFDGGSLVIVKRWADGSTPEPPKRLPDVTEPPAGCDSQWFKDEARSWRENFGPDNNPPAWAFDLAAEYLAAVDSRGEN